MRYAFECSSVMFCCGPCDSMDTETKDLRWMKPYNGGRYRKRTWSMLDGGQVDLLNIRTCATCNDRYHEQIADKDDAWEDRDARAILRKFGQCSESNVQSGAQIDMRYINDPDDAPDDAADDAPDDAADDAPDDAVDDAADDAPYPTMDAVDVDDNCTDDFIMI